MGRLQWSASEPRWPSRISPRPMLRPGLGLRWPNSCGRREPVSKPCFGSPLGVRAIPGESAVGTLDLALLLDHRTTADLTGQIVELIPGLIVGIIERGSGEQHAHHIIQSELDEVYQRLVQAAKNAGAGFGGVLPPDGVAHQLRSVHRHQIAFQDHIALLLRSTGVGGEGHLHFLEAHDWLTKLQ